MTRGSARFSAYWYCGRKKTRNRSGGASGHMPRCGPDMLTKVQILTPVQQGPRHAHKSTNTDTPVQLGSPLSGPHLLGICTKVPNIDTCATGVAPTRANPAPVVHSSKTHRLTAQEALRARVAFSGGFLPTICRERWSWLCKEERTFLNFSTSVDCNV